MLLKPTNGSCPRSFVGRTITTRRSSKPKPRRPMTLERRERRPRGWNGSGELRRPSRRRGRGGRGVSLLVVGIETGTMGGIGVAGRGVELMKERKVRREAARRDVVDIALILTRGINPVVLPDAGPTRRINPTALLDTTLTPTTRKDHTVLQDAPNALTDPVPIHHAVAHIPPALPPNHLPLFHLRWTSISRNRMTPI